MTFEHWTWTWPWHLTMTLTMTMTISFQRPFKDFMLIYSSFSYSTDIWPFGAKHVRVKGTLALLASLLSLSLTLVNPFLFGFNAGRFLGGQFKRVWTLLNWTLTFTFVTRSACPVLQFHFGAIWGLAWVALSWSVKLFSEQCKTVLPEQCKTVNSEQCSPSCSVSVQQPPNPSTKCL